MTPQTQKSLQTQKLQIETSSIVKASPFDHNTGEHIFWPKLKSFASKKARMREWNDKQPTGENICKEHNWQKLLYERY